LKRDLSPVKILDDALDKRIARITDALAQDNLPAPEDVDAAERLSKLKAVLPVADDRRHAKLFMASVVAVGAALLLLIAAFAKRPSTAVELDLRVARVELVPTERRTNLLLPGELGEVLALSQADVAGVEEVDPSATGEGENLHLHARVPVRADPRADLAVRLQELALPTSGPLTLVVGVAYGPGRRGLLLAAQGQTRATVRFGEVIPVNVSAEKQDQRSDPESISTRYAVRPIRASGRLLRLELYPSDVLKPLTALRDVEVSEIRFTVADAPGHSSVLGGTVFVSDLPEGRVIIQPGDQLEIKSDRSLWVRELTFSNGILKVAVSSPRTTSLRLGTDPPRDLMPSFFDWLRSRWPTQFYATLSAIIALWFALKRWWESPT